MNKTEFNSINEVLSEWNPIGVPTEISKDEYTSYVSGIFNYKNDFIKLVSHLEYILEDEIGLNYNEKNIEEKKDILFYAYKLYIALNDDNND